MIATQAREYASPANKTMNSLSWEDASRMLSTNVLSTAQPINASSASPPSNSLVADASNNTAVASEKIPWTINAMNADSVRQYRTISASAPSTVTSPSPVVRLAPQDSN